MGGAGGGAEGWGGREAVFGYGLDTQRERLGNYGLDRRKDFGCGLDTERVWM